MQDVTFAYKPKASVMAVGAAFFGACTVILVNIALTNTSGLVLNGLIELSKPYADLFYFVIAGLSAGMTTFALFGLYVGLTRKSEIRLSADAFTAPKGGFSTHIQSIRYSEIEHLEPTSVRGQEWLTVYHTGGKTNLMRSLFRTKAAYKACLDELFMRVNFAQNKT